MSFLKSILNIIKSTIFYIILICVIIFMINNRDVIILHLYPLPFEIETRTFVLIIFFFLLGFIFGMISFSQNLFINFVNKLKDKRRIRKLEKKLIKTTKN